MKFIISILFSLVFTVSGYSQLLFGDGIPGQELSSLHEGLEAYWNFEEASGSVVDKKNGWTATVGTAPDYQATGRQGYCLDFDATNSEYMTVSSFWNPGTGDWTIAAWIDLGANASNGGICGKVGSDPRWHYRAQYNNYYKGLFDPGPLNLEPSTNSTVSSGGWEFVLIEFDRDGYGTIWLDNVEQTTLRADISSYSSTDMTNTNAFEIGATGNHTTYFHDGKLDELGIWSRLLTSEEKTALYNSGNGIAWPLNY